MVTATYRRAQHDLDTAVKQHRPLFRDALQSFQTIGPMLFDDTVPPDAGHALRMRVERTFGSRTRCLRIIFRDLSEAV